LVAGIMAALGIPSVDKSKPYGRVCIGVVTGEKEEPLQAQSKPGADTFIVAHADANERCQMLLFALNARDGKLAHDWRPQFVELSPREEVLLPEAPIAWKWSAGSEPFDVYVLFVHPNSRDAHELKVLVTAMLNPNLERTLLDRQTVKLRELATGSGARKREIIYAAKVKRVETAVAYRGSFRWRDYASVANFSEATPALLIFRVGD
jgi:hypothetical protein